MSRLFFPSLTLTVPEVSLWSGGVPGLWQQLDNLRSTRCCLESSETPAVKGELFANTQDKALVSGQTDWEAAHLSYLCFLLWGTHPPMGEEGLKKGSISIKSTWPQETNSNPKCLKEPKASPGICQKQPLWKFETNMISSQSPNCSI